MADAMTEAVTEAASRLTEAIGREFRRRMLDEYVPRIGRCVELLDQDQLWLRPGPECNSIANLLLHLEGNVRQWIHAGIAGQADHRHRDGEFAAEQAATDTPGTVLMERLTTTVEEAVRIVEALNAEDYLAVRVYQSRWDETGVAAVLHVLEHFSGHAGQIYAFTKRELGIDLQFFDL